MKFIVLLCLSLMLSGLPEGEPPQAAGLNRAIVTVTAPEAPGQPCRIYYRDRQIDASQLRRELLTDRNLEKVLVIRADKDVPYGVMIKIMNIAKSAGMECRFAVQPLTNDPEVSFVE